MSFHLHLSNRDKKKLNRELKFWSILILIPLCLLFTLPKITGFPVVTERVKTTTEVGITLDEKIQEGLYFLYFYTPEPVKNMVKGQKIRV